MTSNEALRTQIDNLEREKQELEVQNVRLRDGQPERAKLLDQVAEGERLREETERLMEEKQYLTSLYEQLLRDTQDKQSRMTQLREQVEEQMRTATEWEKRFRDLERELARVKDGAELERLCVLEEEKKKQEKREARLMAQLGGGRERTAGEESRPSNLPEHTAERTAGEESPVSASVEQIAERASLEELRHSQVQERDESWATFLYTSAQHLPPLPKFAGEGSSEESNIDEWLEQFELVATACKWDKSARLVNLVT